MIFTLNNKWRFVPRSVRMLCRNVDDIGDSLCKNAREMHVVMHLKKYQKKRCKRT